jgi:hypothetical protein
MADINARIQLELVDGPAQKALADFVKQSGAADKAVGGLNKSVGGLSKGIDSTALRFSGFANIITEDLGGRGSAAVGQFASLLNGPLMIALGSVGAAGLAVKKILDFTFLTERNDQIAASFEAIASSAGLAGNSLRDGLVAAAKGLADDDDLLQAANKSIIELGSNANRIPEIMEIARKSTAIFGGDLIQNFENLSQALASGNTRALRNIGLIIDAEAAQKKYAASLGITADQLSEQGKRQAITNEALEKAQIKFKDVNETSTSASQAFQRFKVAGGELFEGFARLLSQSTLLTTAFNALAKGLELITPDKPRTSLQRYNDELARAQGEVKKYTDLVADGNRRAAEADQSFLKNGDSIRKQVANYEAQLESAKKVVEQRKSVIASLEAESKAQQKVVQAPKAENQVNTDAVLKARTDAAKKVSDAELEIARQTAEFDLQIIAEKLQRRQITEAEAMVLRNEIEAQRRFAEQELEQTRFLEESEALKAKFDAQLLTEQQYYAQRDALANQYAAGAIKRNADEIKSNQRLAAEEEKLQSKKIAAVKDTFGNLAVLMQTSSRELFAIGKAAAIASATINTYEAITKTMASVPYPFNIPLAVAQGIAGFVQVSNIASQNPSFEQGGIVPGTSFTGDRVTANVNSGELILNRSQQTQLFRMANGDAVGSNSRIEEMLAILISKDESVVVNIGGKTIVDTLRSELASGRSFA